MKINEKTKQRLYEEIMQEISEALIKEINILGVDVKNPVQQKISDLTDINDKIPYEDKKTADLVQNIFNKMFTSKYSYFLKQNNARKDIEWSYKVDTACTDGQTGRIIMNPKYMQSVYDRCGDIGVQLIVLHEIMHNYYNKIHKGGEVNSVAANIQADRLINREIGFRWNEFKPIITTLGLLV